MVMIAPHHGILQFVTSFQKNETLMFIKRLKQNVYDVWFENGWAEWTRIRRNHWGISVVSGKRLNRSQIHSLNERLVK